MNDEMKKEVILVLLNEFADREESFIAPALNAGCFGR
jgi:hypothetical protein